MHDTNESLTSQHDGLYVVLLWKTHIEFVEISVIDVQCRFNRCQMEEYYFASNFVFLFLLNGHISTGLSSDFDQT